MSNPAVIKLQSEKVGKYKVWMDDNIGESIHIHIDDYRVDLTVNEFQALYSDLCSAINQLVKIEGFDIRKIDPVFFSVLLWPKLSQLERISYDKVHLGDMLAPIHSKILPLPESIGVKALKGLSNENNTVTRESNHIGQDDNERLENMLNSVKENGYPYEEQFIIMFGNDKIIRDGQHRAACLYYLYGDIEVPVMRMHLRNYKSPNIDRFYNNSMRVLFRRLFLPSIKTILKKFLTIIYWCVRKMRGIFVHSERSIVIDPEILNMFANK